MTVTSPIPSGFHSVTPHLVVYDAVAALDFYERAFGATVTHRLTGPDGRIIYAAFIIGDSVIMLGEECRDYGVFSPTALGNSPVAIHLYVPNADEAFEKAVLAGATIEIPVQEMFWGDRYGKVTDPFGHRWAIASVVRSLSPSEMQAAADAAMACEVKA